MKDPSIRPILLFRHLEWSISYAGPVYPNDYNITPEGWGGGGGGGVLLNQKAKLAIASKWQLFCFLAITAFSSQIVLTYDGSELPLIETSFS